MQGPKQWGFVVERFSGIRYENGRNAKGFSHNERRRRWIPGRVTSGFKRIANAPVRKRRRVGFLLHQHVAIKTFNRLTRTHRFQERIVFFGGGTRQRLEPMGVMRRAFGQSPIFHGNGHRFCQLSVQARAGIHGLHHGFVGFRGKVFPHDVAMKNQATEQFRKLLIEFNRFWGTMQYIAVSTEAFFWHFF